MKWISERIIRGTGVVAGRSTLRGREQTAGLPNKTYDVRSQEVDSKAWTPRCTDFWHVGCDCRLNRLVKDRTSGNYGNQVGT